MYKKFYSLLILVQNIEKAPNKSKTLNKTKLVLWKWNIGRDDLPHRLSAQLWADGMNMWPNDVLTLNHAYL